MRHSLSITRLALAALVGLLFLPAFPGLSFAAGWSAGAAKVVITPREYLWMAGYGARTEPANGKLTELWAKALVLDDGEGNRSVLVTLDLVGIHRDFAREVCDLLEKEHGFARDAIALCTSHTHSGPVVGRNLAPLHFLQMDEAQVRLIEEYREALRGKIAAAVGDAVAAVAPARLEWASGKTTFAVNRRNNKPEDSVPELRGKGELAGPVDHDVPVLAVRGPDGELRAVAFGYACHATTLSLNQWSGDYPGYAQIELEAAHPGCVALFWAGCGGDQNPLPRRTVELARDYGSRLAEAVDEVLEAPMAAVDPVLLTAYREIELPLAALPAVDELEKNAASPNRFEVARAKMLLRQLGESGSLSTTYPYPVACWKLGAEIEFVFLGGEVVVDYALRLKRELRGTRTWVAGYANDVMAYIPSLRVLREGGYEGGGAMTYYGLPTVWSDAVEETIVGAVREEVEKLER